MQNINELMPIGTFENRILLVKDYETYVNKLNDYLTKESYKDLIIDNPIDLKLVKEKRTELNKILDKLKRVRIDTVASITEVYEQQIKTMEKSIEAVSKQLSQNIKTYEELIKPKLEENTPTIYEFSVQTLNKNDLKPFKELAKQLNLKSKTKEK